MNTTDLPPEIIIVQTANVPTQQLVEHPRNANRGNVEAIEESIEHNGFYSRLVVNRRNGRVLVGNHRLRAAIELGMPELPVDFVDVSEADELRIMLADNQTARLGGNDPEALKNLLDELSYTPEGLAGTAHTEADLAALIKGMEDSAPVEPGEGGDDFDPTPEPGPTRARKGDLWAIGPHRLKVADSLDPANYSHFGEEKAVMIFTDPPWNVNYGATSHPSWKKRTIENDNLGSEFAPWISASCSAMGHVAQPGCMVYVVMSAQEWPAIHAGLVGAGFHWSSTIIWNKDSLVLSRKDYHTRYEPIWYGWQGDGPRLAPLEDRKQCDVWDIARPKRSDDHPTMKPVELVERAIANSSKPGDLVLDFFLGSGTTLIASHRQKRKCYGFELDPQYADVILRRAEAEGLDVELLDRIETNERTEL